MTTAQHRRGDTFDRSGHVAISQDGVPVTDLTGWTGRCQIRTADGRLVAEPVFEWLDAQQSLCRVYVPNGTGTAAWPIGPALMDIQFTSPSGDVISTEAAPLQIVKDITHG